MCYYSGFLPYSVYNMHASYVYKRRKLRNSVALLSEDSCAGITNGSSNCNSTLNYGCTSWEKYEHYLNGIPSLPVNTSISVQLHQRKPVSVHASQADDNRHLVLPSQTSEEQEKSLNKPHKPAPRYNSVNDSCSSSKSIMEQEFFSDVTCRGQPVGRPAGSSCSLANVSCARNSDDSACLLCKLCGLKDSPQKMLICDLCEESWHLSCCKVKKLPVDEWYCHPCLSKKPKVPPETLSEKLFYVMSEKKRKEMLQEKLGPILYMLEDTEPYTSGVKIGEDFQAKVPEWAGPTSEYVFTTSCLLHSCQAVAFLS